MLKNGLISRDITLEDCAHLSKLLEKVWKIKTNENYWHWKYLNAPFETKGMIIENKNNDIIGFTGFWGRPTKFGDKQIFPWTIVDVMVDREFRGGKAFGAILERIDLEILEKRLIFGFTNPISHKVFSKHFKDNVANDGRISVYHAFINTGDYFKVSKPIASIADSLSRSIHKLRLSFPGNKDIVVRQVTDIDDSFDQLWEDVGADYFWIQNRGRKFIEWRYTLDPMHKYQIWQATEGSTNVGYLVSTISQEKNKIKGLFVDWLVPHRREDVFRKMLGTAFRWLLDQKVDQVETWLTDHDVQWIKILRLYFFIKSKHPRLFLLIRDHHNTDSNLSKMENFFLTIGDSDY